MTVEINAKYIEVNPNNPTELIVKNGKEATLATILLANGVSHEELGIDPIEAIALLTMLENQAVENGDAELIGKINKVCIKLRVHAQAFWVLLEKSEEDWWQTY